MDKYNFKPKHPKNKSFVMTPQWVFDDGYWGKMSPSAKAIYMVVARHANYQSHNAKASTKTIAKEAGISERIAYIAKRELEGFGLIKRWQKEYNGTLIINLVFKRPDKTVGILHTNKDETVGNLQPYINFKSATPCKKQQYPLNKTTVPPENTFSLNRDTNRDTNRKGEVALNEPLAQKPKEPTQNQEPMMPFESPKGLGPIIKKSVQEISDEKIMNLLKRMTVKELCYHLVKLGYEPEEVISRFEVL